ncbi:uncharacterized protein LOC110281503 [Arachis duranensis]|uniref:Uncharacterized protein LOC110281503 n=1 Tax=Arachis duranensis TaxID=130453 RepID=A0A6P5NT88_ARADU|nr:uncharacterized protein LOC110281503 [Arachis duranensis]
MEREDEDATRERRRLFRRALSSLLWSIEASAAARACRAPVLTFGFYDYFLHFIGAVFDAKRADAILSFEKFCCNLPRPLLQVPYLDYKYPQYPLLPHDVPKRALNFQVGPHEKLFWAQSVIRKGFTGDTSLNTIKIYSALEKLLKDHAGRYATGDEIFLCKITWRVLIGVAVENVIRQPIPEQPR